MWKSQTVSYEKVGIFKLISKTHTRNRVWWDLQPRSSWSRVCSWWSKLCLSQLCWTDRRRWCLYLKADKYTRRWCFLLPHILLYRLSQRPIGWGPLPFGYLILLVSSGRDQMKQNNSCGLNSSLAFRPAMSRERPSGLDFHIELSKKMCPNSWQRAGCPSDWWWTALTHLHTLWAPPAAPRDWWSAVYSPMILSSPGSRDTSANSSIFRDSLDVYKHTHTHN